MITELQEFHYDVSMMHAYMVHEKVCIPRGLVCLFMSKCGYSIVLYNYSFRA